MSYIRDSLGKDEGIIEEFEFHWSIWISFFSFLGLAILSFIGWLISSQLSDSPSSLFSISIIFVLAASYQFLKIKASGRALTNKRIVTKSGIISVYTEETRLPMIETIELRRGILDRILGRGTLKITGSGRSHMLIKHLDKPNTVKKTIELLID